MSQKKDLYVGTDKHRWWKEAVVYQVWTTYHYADADIDADNRSTLLRF